jgi:predicted nucleic-acid-binding protein
MTIVDANIILRYLLADDIDLHERSKQLIETEDIYLPFEVAAEIVYVLEKVYSADRSDIAETLSGLLKYPNIETVDAAVMETGLKNYSSSRLDFVDTMLCGYASVHGHRVVSFDKQLMKMINDKSG